MLCRVVWRKMKFLCTAVFICFLFGSLPAQSAWGDEWGKTLQAAKKEGKVTVYISRFDRVLEAFILGDVVTFMAFSHGSL